MALASTPGEMAFAPRSRIIALRTSVSTARATWGACPLTATRRPSGSVARCTWPIDAAATGSCSRSSRTDSGGGPPPAPRTGRAPPPHPARVAPLDRRRLVAERGQLGLVELAVLGRDELEVDERRELAELHRPAAHR